MQNSTGTKKRHRSCAYPSMPLNQALSLLRRLYDNAGLGPYSREAAAKGLDYSGVSGASISCIAAMAHFGLLEKSNGSYSISPAGLVLLERNDPAAWDKAVVEAAKAPSLYRKLLEAFSGRPLPKLLAQRLIDEFGISSSVSEEAAHTFRETMEFSGLLKEGILVSQILNGRQKESSENAISAPKQTQAVAVKKTSMPVNEGIPLELPSGIKIVFPASCGIRLAMGEFAEEIKKINAKALEDGNGDNSGS